MADRFSIDSIKDLFREDVLRFTTGMRLRLDQLQYTPRDNAALDEVRALGHSLKGTAALVGLTHLSRAGAVIERVGEVASTHLHSDLAEALSIFRQMSGSLGFIEQLLENCLSGGDPETQENLYTEILMTFTPRVRSYLHELDAVDLKGRQSAESTPAPDRTDDEAWANELAQVFMLELQEHLSGVPELATQLVSADTERRACTQLSLIFHTIKGSAAMVQRKDISALAARLQEAFGAAAEQVELRPLSSELIADLQPMLDELFAAAGASAPRLPLPMPMEVEAPPEPAEAAIQLERELLDAFTIDATEAVEAAEQLLLDLERQPDDHELLQALFRHFHTLKGAAAAVGLEAVVEQLHHGESLLETVLDDVTTVDAAKLTDFLFRLTDSVTALINRSRGVRDEQRTILTDVGGEITALMSTGRPQLQPRESILEADRGPEEAAREAARLRAPEHETGIVRVQAGRLDALMNQVGQLVLSRTRMDRKIQAFGELRDKLYYCRTRLAEIIEGFQQRYEFSTGDHAVPMGSLRADGGDGRRSQVDDFFTDLEFDKYDDFNILARSVIELATDTGEIADQLGEFIDAFGEEARQFSKITSGLQRQITRLRLVPLDTVFRRLLRPVRDAARQEGKLVDLQFVGTDVQLDKSIVEVLYAPLLHLVRNAVSHGIEPPALRQTLGKPTVGTIRIVATQRHNSVLLSVQDDGCGLDFDAILAKARAMNLVDVISPPSREQLLPLIFRPGFTTEAMVTDLSGRGVGLDVVAREISTLNGSLLVDSKDGQGTNVRIALPTTTSIDEVLLLQTGEQIYVLPVDFVEQAITIEISDLVQVGTQRMLKHRNQLLPVLLLGPLVGEAVPASAAVAVVLRAGERAMALIVDRVHTQQEAVIRPLGPVLEAHPFLSGATISGAGAVIFVLHVGRLFDVLALVADRQATFILRESTDAQPIEARAILVVDDSISVRKLAARFLETDGFEVDTAVDGLDALDKLASGRFRVVVADLEMPRMHGYDLIAEMRRHPQHHGIPVIVCSSRSSDKHRRRAREVGAEGYITKPFTKEQLVAEIERFTAKGPEHAPRDAAADVGA
jgi:chemosensory pili system protein ChpA (sensor histidine kinase/response regulator)